MLRFRPVVSKHFQARSPTDSTSRRDPCVAMHARVTRAVVGRRTGSGLGQRSDQRCHLVEGGHHLVTRALREAEHRPREAGLGQLGQLGLVRRSTEQPALDRLRIASDRVARAPRSGPTSRAGWRPPIGIQPSQNSAMWAAVFGPALPPRMTGGPPSCVGFGHAQLEEKRTCSPSNDASSWVHSSFMASTFSRRIAPTFDVARAVMRHLLLVPAVPDAEQEPTVRDAVETGHLLRRVDRIALRHEADAGGELDLARHGGAGGERHERVVGAPVELGQRWRRSGCRPTASPGWSGCASAPETRATRSRGPPTSRASSTGSIV